MKISFKKVLISILLLVLAYGVYYLIQAGKIATGYVAKTACSCIMVSKRPVEDVKKTDLSKYGFIDVEVDNEDKSITASALGVISRKAIFRKGLGCTLVNGISEEALRKQISEEEMLNPLKTSSLPWPTGDSTGNILIPKSVDSVKLVTAVNKAFEYPEQEEVVRTRAVVVIYKGKIIVEKYAPGINKDTPLLGWSMAKSITNALMALLVKQHKIDINQKAPIKEWQSDERASITVDQLLRMSSGLDFKEIYNVVADATKMLFNSKSASQVGIEKQLASAPDTEWSYSSGTSNVLSRIIKDKVEGGQAAYFNFPRLAFFNKIGMTSAILEPDPSGTFVGSSFAYATARDWAKFGLLYLNDGVWEGKRILPEGWVRYTSTPTPKAPQGQYGAHFWLNAGENKEGANRKWPDIPNDMFYASGFEGQAVVILPSYDMVIVRLGNTQKREAWDIGVLVKDVIKSVND